MPSPPLFHMGDTMSKYNDLQKKLQNQQKAEKKLKKPDQYDTIFEDKVSIEHHEFKKVFFKSKNDFSNKKPNRILC